MAENEKIPDTPGLIREDLPINKNGELVIPRNKEDFKKKFAADQSEMAWNVFAYCLLLEQGIEATIREYIRRLMPKKMRELEREEQDQRIEGLLKELVEEGR